MNKLNDNIFGIEELNNARFWTDRYTFYSPDIEKMCVRFLLFDKNKKTHISEIDIPMSKLVDNQIEELKKVVEKFIQDRDVYLKNEIKL